MSGMSAGIPIKASNVLGADAFATVLVPFGVIELDLASIFSLHALVDHGLLGRAWKSDDVER